ncbi:hypothetical protein AMS68_002756 [Peltaster fructicola]|uniref:GPI mannosyltransferase 1 n=1 Tax=Peltaster fructicola TaxID=286661 RepID=A0A6H0XRI5_9PEZI|nr:hypothetical protein AMS68_002756 [Peltaster fructicola]
MQLGVAVLGGALLRLLLLAFRYTDIDYLVFTDATRFVALGRSPYDRATYRYTPLLAWLLYPTVWSGWFEFGKILFAVGDLVAGWLIYRILRLRGMNSSSATNYASIWWLNPIVAGISTRGSSEGLLAVIVVAILWSVQTRRIAVAGSLLGLAVHFKIYPFIYAASIFWNLEPRANSSPASIKEQIWAAITIERLKLAIFSFSTFMALNLVMYRFYGMPFIEHSYTYHLTRIDHRHNFSVYNTLLHLNSAYDDTSRLRAESLAFIPQMLLSVVAIPLLLAKKDLAGTMLAQTFAFVTFNKVCTSQYFLWYMVFLPFYLPSSTFLEKPRLGAIAAALWVAGQAAWLQQGYELEFLGKSTFATGLWASSAVFFLVNCWVLGIIVQDVRGVPSKID